MHVKYKCDEYQENERINKNKKKTENARMNVNCQ